MYFGRSCSRWDFLWSPNCWIIWSYKPQSYKTKIVSFFSVDLTGKRTCISCNLKESKGVFYVRYDYKTTQCLTYRIIIISSFRSFVSLITFRELEFIKLLRGWMLTQISCIFELMPWIVHPINHNWAIADVKLFAPSYGTSYLRQDLGTSLSLFFLVNFFSRSLFRAI